MNEPDKCVKKGKLCLKIGVHGFSARIWLNGFVRMAFLCVSNREKLSSLWLKLVNFHYLKCRSLLVMWISELPTPNKKTELCEKYQDMYLAIVHTTFSMMYRI